MNVTLGRWDSTTDQNEIGKIDAVLGRSGLTRHYLPFQGPWSGGFTQFSYDHDRIPVISAEPKNRERWADIAAGRWDAEIAQAAQGIKDIPNRNVPAYIIFNHEPENDTDDKGTLDLGPCGTIEDFKRAADHFRAVIRTVLDSNDALFGVTFMQGTFASGRWQDWVPDRYQILGVDGYNHSTKPESFSSIFAPAHNAAVAARKKFLIEEIGVVEIAGTNYKADFINEMRTTAKTWGNLLAIEWSHVQAKGDYRLTTSPEAQQAWVMMAKDPAYSGTWT